MSVFDKFLKKYGQSADLNDAMLPPPPEEFEGLEFPSEPPVPNIEEVDPEEVGERFGLRYDPEKAAKLRKEIEMLEALRSGNMSEESKARFDAPTVSSRRADKLLKICINYYNLANE